MGKAPSGWVKGMQGWVTAGCSLSGVTLARIPTLTSVTMLGVVVW